MPTYVFKCPKCQSEVEMIMKISEYSSNPRPVCVAEGCDGQQSMETQLQAAPVSFKGTGWTPNFTEVGHGPSTDLLIPKKR